MILRKYILILTHYNWNKLYEFNLQNEIELDILKIYIYIFYN